MTISGSFGEEDALYFELELITSEELDLPVDALFDTGFSYWLAIDKQDLDALNWTYLDQQTMLTARGVFKFDIYAGKIRIDGQELDIPVHVGQGVPEVLLGRKWLQTRRLVVDMPSSILTLG
jgi:clan AA aspartic protease